MLKPAAVWTPMAMLVLAAMLLIILWNCCCYYSCCLKYFKTMLYFGNPMSISPDAVKPQLSSIFFLLLVCWCMSRAHVICQMSMLLYAVVFFDEHYWMMELAMLFWTTWTCLKNHMNCIWMLNAMLLCAFAHVLIDSNNEHDAVWTPLPCYCVARFKVCSRMLNLHEVTMLIAFESHVDYALPLNLKLPRKSMRIV